MGIRRWRIALRDLTMVGLQGFVGCHADISIGRANTGDTRVGPFGLQICSACLEAERRALLYAVRPNQPTRTRKRKRKRKDMRSMRACSQRKGIHMMEEPIYDDPVV